MEQVSFAAIGTEAWNDAVSASDDGWFWHIRLYTDFLLELGTSRGVQDLSFALVDQSRVIAVCPLYLDELESVRQFGCGGEPIPFLAVTRSPLPGQRERALEFFFAELERLAAKHDAAYVRMKVPALAATHVASGLPPFNPMVRFGFLDLPFATQVIDLRQTEERLWAEVRKGHRYDIRRAEKVCETIAWDRHSITTETFRQYQELHRKDAGRVTRSQRSFDLMLEWVRAGLAVLLEARRDDRPIAFVLLTLFGSGAYYGSGCKDPDILELNASHILQWKAMQWLRAQGVHYYDLGIQQFGPQWFHVPSEKELGISKYKRGFGGATIPVHVAEHFYSPTLRAQRMRERFERLVSCVLSRGGDPS